MYRLILLFIFSLLSQGFVSNLKYNFQSQDSLIATVYGSQTLFYNHVDRQNNVRVITDHDRRPIEFYSYTPYGERTIHTRWFGQNRTTSYYDNSVAFTGRYHDKETGLYYFRARYYDSEQGSFISRDPAGYVDGMGLYNGYFASGFTMDPYGYYSWRELGADVASVGIGILKPFKDIADIARDAPSAISETAQGLFLLNKDEAINSLAQGVGNVKNLPASIANGVKNRACKIANGDLEAIGETISDIALFAAGAKVKGIVKGKAPKNVGTKSDIKVIGRLDDTNVAKKWDRHDVLDDSNWSLNKNDKWVKDGINNKQDFYTASPEKGNLIQGSGKFKGEPTIYSRELEQIKAAGYTQVGNTYVAPK